MKLITKFDKRAWAWALVRLFLINKNYETYNRGAWVQLIAK